MLVLPFALVDKVGWLTPIITMMVAYPLLSLDQIGIELENPFSLQRLSHLPLNDICQTIENNLLALLDDGDARVLSADGSRFVRAEEASWNDDVSANSLAEANGRHAAAVGQLAATPAAASALSR
jgi:hypothetical protein